MGLGVHKICLPSVRCSQVLRLGYTGVAMVFKLWHHHMHGVLKITQFGSVNLLIIMVEMIS